MMILQNQSFHVKVEEAHMNMDCLKKKTKCGYILDPKNLLQQSFYKVLLITVVLQDKNLQIALICDEYCVAKQCAVLEDTILTVLQHDMLVQMDVTSGSLVRHQDLEWFGCNFELHKLEKDYLIYGEECVVRLDHELNEKWRFSGTDIFVSASGKQPFELGHDSIRLYDFQDNFYEIDFSGQLIARS